MKVTARATRSGAWWAVEVPAVRGAFTQAKRLDQVPSMVAEVVALLRDVDVDDVEVTVLPILGGDADELVSDAREAARAAAEMQASASSKMRQAVRRLREDEHLTTREAAALLGVSHQRVAQLASSR